jgi:hypothetical protein
MPGCLSGQYTFNNSIATALSPSNVSDSFNANGIDVPSITAEYNPVLEELYIDWSTLTSDPSNASFCADLGFEGTGPICIPIQGWRFQIGNGTSDDIPAFNVTDSCSNATENSQFGCTVECFKSVLSLQQARESGWMAVSADANYTIFELALGLDLYSSLYSQLYHVVDVFATIQIPKEVIATNHTEGNAIKENELAQIISIRYEKNEQRMCHGVIFHTFFVKPLLSVGEVFGDNNYTVNVVFAPVNCDGNFEHVCSVGADICVDLTISEQGMVSIISEEVEFDLPYEFLGNDTYALEVYKQGQQETYGNPNVSRFEVIFPAQEFTLQEVGIFTVEPQITWVLKSIVPVKQKSDIEFKLCIKTDALVGGNGDAKITYLWSCGDHQDKTTESCFEANRIDTKNMLLLSLPTSSMVLPKQSWIWMVISNVGMLNGKYQ